MHVCVHARALGWPDAQLVSCTQIYSLHIFSVKATLGYVSESTLSSGFGSSGLFLYGFFSPVIYNSESSEVP